MSPEETKHTGKKTASADSGFGPMRHMMSQKMNTCCTGGGGFPDCSTMMKDVMKQVKNQSSTPQEASTGSEEGKK